jgi:hypothetical protein
MLPLHAKSFSARRKEVHARGVKEEAFGEKRHGFGHVLAIVEHEEDTLVLYEGL